MALLLRRKAEYDRARILDGAARARAKKKRARAIELYRWVLAVEPQNPELHGKLAPLLAETGQHFDAWTSFKAIARARRVRDLDPWNFEAVLDLARLLAIQGQAREARMLLDGLEERCGGERLRRVRAAQFQIWPTPLAAWRWLRDTVRPAPEPAPRTKREPAGVVKLHKSVVRRA